MVLGGNAAGNPAALFLKMLSSVYPLSKPRMTVRVVTTAGFLLHLSTGPTGPLVDPKMVPL
jgi:hypothetical protein